MGTQLCKVKLRRGDSDTKHCWHRAGATKDNPNYNSDIRVMHSVCCWCGERMEKAHGQHMPLEN